jgi:hypothetical protein
MGPKHVVYIYNEEIRRGHYNPSYHILISMHLYLSCSVGSSYNNCSANNAHQRFLLTYGSRMPSVGSATVKFNEDWI